MKAFLKYLNLLKYSNQRRIWKSITSRNKKPELKKSKMIIFHISSLISPVIALFIFDLYRDWRFESKLKTLINKKPETL